MNTITLDYRAHDYHLLESATLEALKDGLTVTLNLDVLAALEADDVRRLIVLLRRTREIGGDFTLRAGRPAVRRTLSVMALDRVFTVVGSDAA